MKLMKLFGRKQNELKEGNKQEDLDKFNFEDLKDRNRAKQWFENFYNAPFEWFKEERGNKNWVLYPTNVYEICTDRNGIRYLHALDKTLISYDGAVVFPPYNASSFYKLFEKSNCNRINISKWDFGDQIVDINFMFFECCDLCEIQFSKHNSHGIKTLCATFANCYSLQKLDLSWIHSNEIEDISVCFTWCSNLRELKIPNLLLSENTKTKDVFNFCNEVMDLDIEDKKLKQLYERRTTI